MQKPCTLNSRVAKRDVAMNPLDTRRHAMELILSHGIHVWYMMYMYNYLLNYHTLRIRLYVLREFPEPILFGDFWTINPARLGGSLILMESSRLTVNHVRATIKIPLKVEPLIHFLDQKPSHFNRTLVVWAWYNMSLGV